MPYTLWVFMNGRNMWDHKWKFSEDNKDCSELERAKYNKYNKMKRKELMAASHEEKLEHASYLARKGLYTEGVPKKTFSEAVSSTGREMLGKFTKKWRAILKNEDLKEKMKESWQDLEDWHLLEESIWKGSKRKVDESTMPDLPDGANTVSPRSVVLFPGDEGYEEYIEQCDGDDSSDDDNSEDEGVEQQVHGI